MKTIGLLGGMSWESTLEYYRLINLEVKKQLGGSHSAKILMYSFDYHELEKLLEQNQWDEITKQLVDHGKRLKEAGAQVLVICANTMHIVADEVEKQVGLPLIHIAKATLFEAQKFALDKVLLLGTKYTMESILYPNVFIKDNISVLTPNDADQALIHHTIYKELILGIFSNESKSKFVDIINHMKDKGIQGVILGCTEIPMLIQQKDLDIPVLNTMQLHVNAMIEFVLK